MQHLSSQIIANQNGYYLIEQLLINFNKAGTRDYLISNLNKMNKMDLQLWLPQFCYFFVRNNVEKLGNFLKDLALTNLQTYYLIEWLLKSLDDQSGNETHVLQFRRELEIDYVNNGTQNGYIYEKVPCEDKMNKMMLEKEYRSSYIVGSDHLISSLIQFSLTLKSIAYLERKVKTTSFLRDINSLIQRMSYTLHPGVTIPFCLNNNSCLMVNILENEFTCYNTANRVPYRIIIETVDPIEFQLFEQLTQFKEQQFDIRGSKFEIKNDLEDQMRKIALSKMFNYQNIDDLKKLAIDHFNKKNKLIKKPIQDVYASKYETNSVWGQPWEQSALQFKKESQYGQFKSYQLRQIIIKGGDDLRQELLVMQILNKIKNIWEQERQPLYLKPYEIIITSPSSGIIEFIPNTISIDSLKGKYPNLRLRQLFEQEFGDNFFDAQQNFANSLAAYSIVCYLIQLKDRHNGNILIDNKGNIIHIDFGFILTLTPGNLGFESAPFKLVDEYIELLDGINSSMMCYFETMIFKGLLTLQKHVDEIILFIKAFTMGDKKKLLYCLQKLSLKELRQRFCEQMSIDELMIFTKELVKSSINSWSTSIYDYFQYKSNGINY